MRVYEIVGTIRYGGGLALVAARSRVEALNTLMKDGEISWSSEILGLYLTRRKA